MEKKIIAIALVLVLMVTVFVGCSKKRETTEVNGKDYILYTDAEGNTVINENNQVIAVVTDENGEVVTFENGEDQTYFVQIDGAVIKDGVMKGTKYEMNVIEGWTASENGKMYKDGTENKCYVQFVEMTTLGEDETFDIYLEKIDLQYQPEAFEDAGQKVEVEDEEYVFKASKGTTTISNSALACTFYTYKILNANGEVIHYAENYYFAKNGVVYMINYACVDGIGYDENFNFENYINANFTFTK